MFNRLRHRLRRNFYRAMENNDVTLEQLKQMQNEGATIIDVRSPLEYKEGHIQGAISLPEYEIRKNINKYIKNQNEKIVLYCQTGHYLLPLRSALYTSIIIVSAMDCTS